MLTINNVHQQFAAFFKNEKLQPYAFLVSKKLSEGHICIDLNELSDEPDFENVPGKNNVKNYTTLLSREPLVTTISGIKQPFVLHNEKLYLQRYFHYETIILQRIKQFIFSEQNIASQRMDELAKNLGFIQQLFPAAAEKTNDETDWQMVAAIGAVLNNFTIITGGPGTGKTTTVAKIVALLFTINPLLKVALAAPTGKAAARMAESLKATTVVNKAMHQTFQTHVPSTLHRLLKLSPGSTQSKYNKENPLDYDLIIVDESSMIDVSLFAKLLSAVGDHTRLILIGDKDQLASVEAGSLFGDLCNAQPELNLFAGERAAFINGLFSDKKSTINDSNTSDHIHHPLFQHIVELRHSHRFSGHEGIGRFSKAVISNNADIIQQFFKPGFDVQVAIDNTYSDAVFNKFVSGYSDYILEKDITKALAKFNNLRVLCAVREGNYGLYAINKKIEMLLQQKGLLSATGEYYEHRPIMVTKNYYDLQLFNGDIGIIRADENGTLKVWFLDSEQNLKSILPGFVGDSETVFAMTIHKSQGSEFDNVMVMLPDAADIELLTRELLYTAVTRAKKQVIIQGTEEIILQTAARSVKRVSGIRERFFE